LVQPVLVGVALVLGLVPVLVLGLVLAQRNRR